MTTTSVDSTSKFQRVLTAVAKRWPTLVGIASGADVLLSEITGETTHGYAEALLILPLGYVVLTLLRRRRLSWPVLFGAVALMVGLRLQDWVDPPVAILAVALGATIWGTGHGHHREREFRLQVIGMAGFFVFALTGLVVDPELGRYLVGIGWLAHGVWDFVHLRRDRVVSRSYAEWCGTFDIIVGVSLIVLA
jgi:hypothetical protein